METFHSAGLAVNTQTPVVRSVDGERKATTGGVVRMLVPLLRIWKREGRIRDAEWVAMGSSNEEILEDDGLRLSFVDLPPDERQGYAVVKERMWAMLNSNPGEPVAGAEDPLPSSAWDAFETYQLRSARALAAASERMGNADLLYVHDFQQLGVARAWEGAPTPKVFHLHTPFPSELPDAWSRYIIAHLETYDAVIVSTERYAQNLRAAGHGGPIHVVHPFIDPSSYERASDADASALRERFRIAPSDRIILNVARMDPMKGQDRLLDAMPHVLRSCPEARLVLVGNGSFSSSKKGGLGLNKGQAWRAKLEAQARALGIEHRVTFTGHLGERDVSAAYEACEVFSLPSTREGFGLATIEAWRHQKPVVVSERAGVSELVHDHVNGISVDAASPKALAEALLDALRDPDIAREMGRQGFQTSRAATLETGRRSLETLFTDILQERPHVIA